MKTLNKNKKTLECLKIYDNNNTNLIIKFIDEIKLYKSETTLVTYSNNIRNFYEFLDKNYNTNFYLVDRKCLENYIEYQVNKKLGADIIHSRITTVKNYFKFLLKNKKITTETFFDMFDELKTPKVTVKNQLLIKAKETIEITKKINLNSFSSIRNTVMILLMSNTGIRRKELAHIDINNINLLNNTITIYKTKGDKPRVVSFSEIIKIKLIEYLGLRIDVLKRKKIEHNILFITKNGDPVKVNTISTIMFYVSRESNTKVTCHSLRRGFATDMAECGTDIYVISKMLGHSNINTTVSRYIYVLSSMIKEAMENHPFAKHQTNKVNSINNKIDNKKEFDDLLDNSLIKEMFEDITSKMNKILKSLPDEYKNIKEV